MDLFIKSTSSLILDHKTHGSETFCKENTKVIFHGMETFVRLHFFLKTFIGFVLKNQNIKQKAIVFQSFLKLISSPICDLYTFQDCRHQWLLDLIYLRSSFR